MSPQNVISTPEIHGLTPYAASAHRSLTVKNFLLSVLLSLAALTLLPARTLAQSALTDDANTINAPRYIDANFGTNPNLNVSASGNVYVKFKLSSSLPAGTPGSEVEKAAVNLYIGNITTAGKLDVYAVAGAWDESTITANNAPPLGSLVITTAQIGTDKRGKFLVIDITALVQQWLGDDGLGAGGIPNNGIALVAHSTDMTTPEVANITFDSKENSQTSHEAQLNIQLKRAADGLLKVERDATLTGDGTTASPLGVAVGGIHTVNLADDAVTGDKIADSAVTTAQLADGAVTSAKITAPLSLTSADSGATLSVVNAGAGAAIKAIGAIDTMTQYNIGGNRVLAVPGAGGNLVAGVSAGAGITTGQNNSFFGNLAGLNNTTGFSNSFFGTFAGSANLTGESNSFFGRAAGFRNTTGSGNAFFGRDAGVNNTTGASNSFFGFLTGTLNTTGLFNSFFGREAGVNNTTGNDNAFLGNRAGLSNTTEDHNTFVGAGSNGVAGITNATAIGFRALVTQSNSLVLGGINGVHEADASVNVGIGTTAPTARLTVFADSTSPVENTATFRAPNIGANQSHIHYGTTGDWYIRSASNTGKVILQDSGGNVGIGTSAPTAQLHVQGGNIYIGAAGQGIILKSPDGTTCRVLTIDNAGAMVLSTISCP
ncbi:MAG TPA: DNRLRE domain-containing protein [Pyrinomonadaceae bacterium]|nr:DNRLRE domain-containing protein [Pyrinomonadaceae bacterium]